MRHPPRRAPCREPQAAPPYRRITIKIGSALLVDRGTGLQRDWLRSLAADIAGLVQEGCEVVIVSSGAIALGRTVLGLGKRVLKLEESQAAASAGQIALAGAGPKRSAGTGSSPARSWSRSTIPRNAATTSTRAPPSRRC